MKLLIAIFLMLSLTGCATGLKATGMLLKGVGGCNQEGPCEKLGYTPPMQLNCTPNGFGGQTCTQQ